MNVNILKGELSEREQEQYIRQLKEKHPNKILTEVNFTIDGDDVIIVYEYDDKNGEEIE